MRAREGGASVPDRVDAPVRRGHAALLPLAWLYAAGVALVRCIQTARRPAAGGAVLSVGALEVGGSGKTPLAMLLLEELGARGKRCAYASRGFGSRSARSRVVTVVQESSPSTAPARAGTRIVSRHHPDLAREVGDEAAAVAERLPGAALFLSRDKRRAVAEALKSGMDVVVVDDAFQTWRLPRTLDVVLLDAGLPTANGRVLPAGPLREHPRALARADAIVFNGAASQEEVALARSRVARWVRAETPAHGLRRVTHLQDRSGRERSVPTRALLVSAIARPDAFARSLRALGVDVVGHAVFRDHHAYTGDDANSLAERCGGFPGASMIMTEKDWVKLRRFDWSGVDVCIARLDVEWVTAGLSV